MKASQLIAALQELVAQHGDRDVFTFLPDESTGAVRGVELMDDEPGPRDDQYQIGDFYIS